VSGRVQPVVATVCCSLDSKYSFSASAGVFQPSVLAGATVEGGGDRGEVPGAVSRQVGSSREVLPQQPVGVLVGAALPGALWVAEVDLEAVSIRSCACWAISAP
jgi:hypothetical protein